MKHFLLLLLLSIGLNCSGQNFHLMVIGSSNDENKLIDSIGYTINHKNVKSVNDEIYILSEKLSNLGYIENKTLENSKKNDSLFEAKISLGDCIKKVHIYIGRDSILNELSFASPNKDTLTINYVDLEFFLNKTLKNLEQKGFAQATFKLTNVKIVKKALFADLKFDTGVPRKLDAIVINEADYSQKNSFPKGHLAQLNRKYKRRTFNQEIVNKIHDDFDKFGFVSQIKFPEILFTKDSTKLYVYLGKRSSNTFDGFIGFSNDKNNKLVFNGYLDLLLENILKLGEQFSLYWKSDGNNQKSFKASIDIPYIFKSPIGVKAQIQIYKQDSLFQNTKTAIHLGYLVNYNTRLYLGYQSTESSGIQKSGGTIVNDFQNSFLTTSLEYTKKDIKNPIFINKTNLMVNLGIGARTTTALSDSNSNINQTFINLIATHNFMLGKNQFFNINYQNYFLQSSSYIVNELYRFGGIHSVRGFLENSLQANFTTSFSTEYRYLVSQQFYLHTITDYGYYQDKTTNQQGFLFGIGAGMALQTKNGTLKVSFASGKIREAPIKFNNSIVSLNYSVAF